MNNFKVNTKAQTKTVSQTTAFLNTLAGRIKDSAKKCEDGNCANYLSFKSEEIRGHANNGIGSKINPEFVGKLMETSKNYPKNLDASQAFKLANEISGLIGKNEIRMY